MSDPWTRAEQINYATFGTKEAPKEWDAVWDALQAFAHATGSLPGDHVLTHFISFDERYTSASMSVD